MAEGDGLITPAQVVQIENLNADVKEGRVNLTRTSGVKWWSDWDSPEDSVYDRE